MADKKRLERLFEKHGFPDFRWINPKDIVVAQWVRLKCMFGCDEYGHSGCCPPNTPSVAECDRFFHEYKSAVIFHFEKKVAKPEYRHAWARKVNLKLLGLEREVFCAGHEKAFLLIMDSCNLCAACRGKRDECQKPMMARPGPDAMAVDVYATVRRAGYPIAVLPDYEQVMNRYAFLMID